MAGLDTNILVRWLVADDQAQLAQVEKLFAAAASEQTGLFVSDTVVLELEWVLRSRYGFTKSAITGSLNALLETRELAFQTEAAVEYALHVFRENKADFADCLHVGLYWAAQQAPMLTFDAKAARLEGARTPSDYRITSRS